MLDRVFSQSIQIDVELFEIFHIFLALLQNWAPWHRRRLVLIKNIVFFNKVMLIIGLGEFEDRSAYLGRFARHNEALFPSVEISVCELLPPLLCHSSLWYNTELIRWFNKMLNNNQACDDLVLWPKGGALLFYFMPREKVLLFRIFFWRYFITLCAYCVSSLRGGCDSAFLIKFYENCFFQIWTDNKSLCYIFWSLIIL